MSIETKEELVSKNNFWNKLGQKKFDLYYYDAHFQRCIKINRIFKIIISVGTIIPSAIFMNWYELEYVRTICFFAILALQLLNAFFENLPFERRRAQLVDISREINEVYNDMERDWFKIVKGELELNEIDEKLFLHIKKCDNIYLHYFKEDALPKIPKLKVIAQEQADEYMKILIGENYADN